MLDNLSAIYLACKTIPSARAYPADILQHHGYPGVSRAAAREAFIRHHVQQAVLGLLGTLSWSVDVGQPFDLVRDGVADARVVEGVIFRLHHWRLTPAQAQQLPKALGADLLALVASPESKRWTLKQTADDHLAIYGQPPDALPVREPRVKARTVRMRFGQRAET